MRGMRDSFPVCVAASTFALVYGAVAAEKGLTLLEGTLLSAVVFAGASQFIALQFWQQPLPYVTIAVVVFAINFRHIFYGASLSRKLGKFTRLQKVLAFFFMVDPAFALSEKRYQDGEITPGDAGLTPAYYFGIAGLLYPMWTGFSMIGLAFGNLIENPEIYGLDFILPIYFMILLLGFKSRANWWWVVIASAVATVLAVITVGSPWHISIGGVTGVIVGAALGSPKKPIESGKEA